MAYKVLVALDFSKLGKEVAAYGFDIAKKLGGTAAFLHVIPEPEPMFKSYAVSIPKALEASMREIRSASERKLHVYIEDFCGKEGGSAPKCEAVVEIGDPAKCIMRYAKEGGFDMIVLGYRGHTPIDEFLVGSTVNKVARYAPCSVLIYRPEDADK